jgi:hypothetical protein
METSLVYSKEPRLQVKRRSTDPYGVRLSLWRVSYTLRFLRIELTKQKAKRRKTMTRKKRKRCPKKTNENQQVVSRRHPEWQLPPGCTLSPRPFPPVSKHPHLLNSERSLGRIVKPLDRLFLGISTRLFPRERLVVKDSWVVVRVTICPVLVDLVYSVLRIWARR